MATPVFKRLDIKGVWDLLSPQEKVYAHHMSRQVFSGLIDAAAPSPDCSAASLGTRIVLRQVSPESNSILDLILELHQACNGEWERLLEGADDSATKERELLDFLNFAALFLSNMGNYYVRQSSFFVT